MQTDFFFEIAIYIFLFILGSALGSFLCCQARRLHLRDSAKSKKLPARSVCLHCGYQLKWYDNLPILSWLLLRGRCRECHKKIGLTEFLAELGTALALPAAFYAFAQTTCLANAFFCNVSSLISAPNPLTLAALIISILFLLVLVFLAVYDGLYGQLPTIFLFLALLLSVALLVLRIVSSLQSSPFSMDLIWKPLLSALILGGLYLFLYLISKGKWVGDGDWLLGLAIALALFEPLLSLFVLFLSNLLACFVMTPAFFLKRRHKIYFGPFLVLAYVLVCLLSTSSLIML